LNVTGQKHKSKHKKSAKQSEQKVKSKILYGQASYYSDKFNGRKTASGEIFSQKKLTAACNKLPLGTRIKVTNISNGDTVIVKVNDRLHPKMKRVVDLSKAAAKKIGLTTAGVTRVKVEVVK
jgi:rare lipoprotein A